jgi:hypothetical protein
VDVLGALRATNHCRNERPWVHFRKLTFLRHRREDVLPKLPKLTSLKNIQRSPTPNNLFCFQTRSVEFGLQVHSHFFLEQRR